MRARDHGSIVNVSSIAGTNALPGLAPHSASKAGLSHFTAGLRADLKGTSITTTLVQIGAVESTMIESVRSHPPARRAFGAALFPLLVETPRRLTEFLLAGVKP
jgi:short-subunit dehydrogenase